MVNMKGLYKYLIDFIFPNRCPCCNKLIKWNELICEYCIKDFPKIKIEPCIKCGKTNCICGNDLSYDYCVATTYYEGIIKRGILNLKLKNGINFAEYFAEIIVIKLNELHLTDKIDIVTSVPMSKNKLIERGYNQADVIARIISKKINKPLINNLIKKKNINFSQHELNYDQRLNCAQDIFYVNNNNKYLNNKCVLLCDDVITTSSTLNECSKLLKKLNAENVLCAVIATTNLHNNL